MTFYNSNKHKIFKVTQTLIASCHLSSRSAEICRDLVSVAETARSAWRRSTASSVLRVSRTVAVKRVVCEARFLMILLISCSWFCQLSWSERHMELKLQWILQIHSTNTRTAEKWETLRCRCHWKSPCQQSAPAPCQHTLLQIISFWCLFLTD